MIPGFGNGSSNTKATTGHEDVAGAPFVTFARFVF